MMSVGSGRLRQSADTKAARMTSSRSMTKVAGTGSERLVVGVLGWPGRSGRRSPEGPRDPVQRELHLVGADDVLVEIAEDGIGQFVLLGETEAVIGSLGADGHQ